MRKNEARLYDEYVGTVDKAVKLLVDAKNKNDNIYIEFNGVKLYSAIANEEYVYFEILGCSKEEHEQDRKKGEQEYRARVEEERREALSIKDESIYEGYTYIYPQKKEEWNKYVSSSINGVYGPKMIKEVLKVMKKLESGDEFEDVLKEFSDSHSRASFNAALNAVAYFSKRGPQLYQNYHEVHNIKMSEAQIKSLNEIKEENKKFEQELMKNKDRR